MFGLPLHAREDDAERAVVFAMRVVPQLERVVGHVTIGVSRGRVFCGTIGHSSLRESYDVLGVPPPPDQGEGADGLRANRLDIDNRLFIAEIGLEHAQS